MHYKGLVDPGTTVTAWGWLPATATWSRAIRSASARESAKPNQQHGEHSMRHLDALSAKDMPTDEAGCPIRKRSLSMRDTS